MRGKYGITSTSAGKEGLFILLFDLCCNLGLLKWDIFRYFYTGRLTESSDVYSFGVVLLETATGEPPILPGLGHIVQRVKRKIDAGNIDLVADARLRGAYNISSMWKVVDVALLCTADVGNQRPTMAAVVMQLKESLALEEARAYTGFQGSVGTLSDTTISASTFGPSVRWTCRCSCYPFCFVSLMVIATPGFDNN